VYTRLREQPNRLSVEQRAMNPGQTPSLLSPTSTSRSSPCVTETRTFGALYLCLVQSEVSAGCGLAFQ
jgi:hypothetical protein